MRFLLKQLLIKLFKSPGLWLSTFLIFGYIPIIPGAYNDGLIATPIIFCVLSTALTITIIGSWGYSLANIKTSSIIDRIKVSQSSKYNLLLISFIPLLVSIFYIIGLSSFALWIYSGPANIIDSFDLNIIQWENFVVFILINIFISMALVFFFIGIFKTITAYQSFVWIYTIFILIFGGSTVPIYIIIGGWNNLPPSISEPIAAFTYISYIFPSTYVNFGLAKASVDNFNYSNLEDVTRIIVPTLVGCFLLSIGTILIKRW